MIITILVGMQLFVSHRLSTAGIKVTEMAEQTEIVSRENEVLRHKIASASSFLTITERARVLGFTEASIRHIEQPPVAMIQ